LRIVVLAVGRLRPPYADDVQHYKKLLAGHARVELEEVREDERVPRRIPQRAFICLLAADGVAMSSLAFSKFLGERRMEGRDLCFVIGGPRGLDLDSCPRASMYPSPLRDPFKPLRTTDAG